MVGEVECNRAADGRRSAKDRVSTERNANTYHVVTVELDALFHKTINGGCADVALVCAVAMIADLTLEKAVARKKRERKRRKKPRGTKTAERV